MRMGLVGWAGRAGAMKVVDMQEVTLVHSGREWEFEQAPCSREMIRHLERNEGFVTWLQPKGGSVQDQFPVIRTRLGCCTMSLRMMKAVWCVSCVVGRVLGMPDTAARDGMAGGTCACARAS